jgi:hypothetical protein
MTDQARGPGSYLPERPDDFDFYDPENMAPLVAWLSSAEAAHVTGRVFTVRGGQISVAEGWHAGPMADKRGRWDAAELGPVVTDLVDRAARNADLFGVVGTGI